MTNGTAGITRRAALMGIPGLAIGSAALAQSGQTPQRGGILTFAVGAEPPTYDLHQTGTFAVMHRLAPHYSTLLSYEPGNYPNIVGDLAESWTVAPDLMTYTFRIHANVRFHDGTPLTAEDVRVSYERLRNPPPGVKSDRQPAFEQIASIETPDDRTIVFRMKKVDASIMDTFASPWNSIHSAARLRQDPNFPVRNVMGSGPFRFVEHVAGSHWSARASTAISSRVARTWMASAPSPCRHPRWSMRCRGGRSTPSSEASRRMSATGSSAPSATRRRFMKAAGCCT